MGQAESTDELPPPEDETEVIKLDAKAVGPSSTVQVVSDWNFCGTRPGMRALNKGDTLFCFSCKVGSVMSEREREVLKKFVNLTSFEDEVADNNVPTVDVSDNEDMAKYTIVMVKTGYLVKGVKAKDFTPQLIASYKYQVATQPNKPTIWKEVPDDVTFRFTKSIVPVVYDVTAQLKVSVMKKEAREDLANVDGLKIDHALVMERTKRNSGAVDGTAKAKSLLLYSDVPGGVYVANLTAVLNTSIPSIMTGMIENMGPRGANEAAETAMNTRRYIAANGPKILK